MHSLLFSELFSTFDLSDTPWKNNRLEAKRAQGGLPHSIWETYSAFANTFGGYILLGVVENADKSFSSVPLPDPERLVADFWNSVNNRAVTNVKSSIGKFGK